MNTVYLKSDLTELFPHISNIEENYFCYKYYENDTNSVIKNYTKNIISMSLMKLIQEMLNLKNSCNTYNLSFIEFDFKGIQCTKTLNIDVFVKNCIDELKIPKGYSQKYINLIKNEFSKSCTDLMNGIMKYLFNTKIEINGREFIWMTWLEMLDYNNSIRITFELCVDYYDAKYANNLDKYLHDVHCYENKYFEEFNKWLSELNSIIDI